MTLTVLKTYYRKQEATVIFYRDYKKFSSTNFRTELDKEFLKQDLNNIEIQTFHSIFLAVLDRHAPLKQKYLRANNASFVTKELRQAIMKRSKLRNSYLKHKTEREITGDAYRKQRNLCVSLLKKSKRYYFGKFDVKNVTENKNVWSKVSPLFSN